MGWVKGMPRAAVAVMAITSTVVATALPAAGSAPPTSDTGATEASGETAELSPLRVTSIGFCNEGYLWWAQEKGIFEEHGLDVELVSSQGGAAGIAAIMSEAADLSFTNGFTALISLSQGFPVRFVAGAYENAPPGQPGVQGLWVRTDSGITSVKDLAGKRVAINELAGINQIVTNVWLRKEGVDPTSVRFVALPFGQLLSSVVDGQVDVAMVANGNVGPDAAAVLTNLGDPYQLGPGRVVYAGYLSTADWLAEHDGEARAFQAALDESMQQIQSSEHIDEAFEVAAANCRAEPEVLSAQPQNPYDATIDVELLEQMADILVEEGLLREAPDLTDFVPEFARR